MFPRATLTFITQQIRPLSSQMFNINICLQHRMTLGITVEHPPHCTSQKTKTGSPPAAYHNRPRTIDQIFWWGYDPTLLRYGGRTRVHFCGTDRRQKRRQIYTTNLLVCRCHLLPLATLATRYSTNFLLLYGLEGTRRYTGSRQIDSQAADSYS
jgi:hypothetical protein